MNLPNCPLTQVAVYLALTALCPVNARIDPPMLRQLLREAGLTPAHLTEAEAVVWFAVPEGGPDRPVSVSANRAVGPYLFGVDHDYRPESLDAEGIIWMLEQNARSAGVAFAVGTSGRVAVQTSLPFDLAGGQAFRDRCERVVRGYTESADALRVFADAAGEAADPGTDTKAPPKYRNPLGEGQRVLAVAPSPSIGVGPRAAGSGEVRSLPECVGPFTKEAADEGTRRRPEGDGSLEPRRSVRVRHYGASVVAAGVLAGSLMSLAVQGSDQAEHLVSVLDRAGLPAVPLGDGRAVVWYGDVRDYPRQQLPVVVDLAGDCVRFAGDTTYRVDDLDPEALTWMLERNAVGAGVAFAVDEEGRVLVIGSLPAQDAATSAVAAVCDRVACGTDEAASALGAYTAQSVVPRDRTEGTPR